MFYLLGLLNKSYRHIKLLPIEWLDENTTNLKATLAPQEYTYSYGPQTSTGNQKIESVKLPMVNLYYFENARVSVVSSSILTDHKIIIERVEGVDANRSHYYSGHVLLHGLNSALVRHLQTGHLEQGIFLGGNGSFNYYHWMIEILTKLKYLNELDKHGYEDFPLLVSEDVNHIGTYREALNSIVKNRPVVILNKDKTYHVDKLVYINAPNTCPFNLRQNERYRISDFLTRVSTIDFLRNQMSQSICLPPRANKRNRIFLARSHARRSYNQDEIFEIFRQQGFQKVFMDQLSLKEQISSISNAEIIAGPTGAAWTNLIFCRKGTKCLCWMADGYGEFSAYSNLSRLVGADMRYIIFKTNARSVGELYNKSYSIDIKQVKQNLDKLISEVD